MVEDTAVASTVGGLLREWNHLRDVSDSPQLDCQLILANVLERPRTWLLAHHDEPVSETDIGTFYDHLKRRASGEPTAYITGKREFWSMELAVTPDTLIPRPETELLVETALGLLDTDPKVVVDLGTGSGAIALALASERPAWQVIATDRDTGALKVARNNARRLGLENVDFLLADWCRGLSALAFDLIVCNPPYVEADDPHLDDLGFEPKQALVSAHDGMADIETIVSTCRPSLKPGGLLLLEHGYNQQHRVVDLLATHGFDDVRPLTDLAGQPRAVVATRGEFT